MSEYILSYEKYLYKDIDEQIDEGWKSWLAAFMILLNLGVVPPKIQASDIKTKIEWTQSIPKNVIGIAKFISLLSIDKNISPKDEEKIRQLLKEFNDKNNTNISYKDVMENTRVQTYKTQNNKISYKWTLTTFLNEEDPSTYTVNIKDLEKGKFQKKESDTTYVDVFAFVNDYGDFLLEQEEESLNEDMYKYYELTGYDIKILTIPSFYGEDPKEYTKDMYKKWSMGKETNDNSILIVTSMGDRRYFIKIGDGLEDTITEEKCNEIGENYIVKNFANGNYYKGFEETINILKKELGSESLKVKKEKEELIAKARKEGILRIFIIMGISLGISGVVAIIVWYITFSIKKRKKLSAKIYGIKEQINKNFREIGELLVYGDPMFNDEEVLRGLQQTLLRLYREKIKNDKKLNFIISEVEKCIRELNNIKRIEKDVLKLKESINSFRNKFQEYENQPELMVKYAQESIKILNEVNFENIEISDNSVKEYVNILNNLTEYYNEYYNYEKKIKSIKIRIGQFDETKEKLISRIEKSKEFVQKVKEFGYTIESDVTPEEIESLRSYINAVKDLFEKDVEKSFKKMDEYWEKLQSTIKRVEAPMKMHSDILKAKEFIYNSEQELENKVNKLHQKRGNIIEKEYKKALIAVDKYNEIVGKLRRTPEDPYGEEEWDTHVEMKDVLKISNYLRDLLKSLENLLKSGKFIEVKIPEGIIEGSW